MTLMLVGDSDQQLFRFAGARPELINGEIDQYIPNIETVKLNINYRSTHQIIDICQTMIAQNYSDNGGPYDQEFMKVVQARGNAEQGNPVIFTEYDDSSSEAQGIVNELKILLDQKLYTPGQIFISARTRAQLGYLEGQLIKAKIPFINIKGSSFWASKHVADVIAYVRLAYDKSDKGAFKRVYNIASAYNIQSWGKNKGQYCSHRYLGKEFLAACNETYTNIYKTLDNRSRWQKDRRIWEDGVNDLENLLLEIESALAQNDISAALQLVIDKCYLKWLETEDNIQDEENNKLDDLETVIGIAGEFEDTESFFQYVDEAIQTAEAAKGRDWDKYVILSTIHGLKGLEREVVFGLGLSEGRDRGLLPHTFSLIRPPQFGVFPAGEKGRIEDERCMAFVLVSRAMERVYLSGVKFYRKTVLVPSRFVGEMGLNE